MTDAKFKYDLDETVVDPHGEEGIITMQAIDRGGVCYHVNTRGASSWFYEDQLKAV